MYEDYISVEEFEIAIEQLKNSLRDSFGEFLYAREFGTEEIELLMQFDIDIAQKCIDFDNIHSQIDALLKRLEDENISSIVAMFKSQQSKIVSLEEQIAALSQVQLKIDSLEKELASHLKVHEIKVLLDNLHDIEKKTEPLKDRAIKVEIYKTESNSFTDGTTGYIIYFRVKNRSKETLKVNIYGTNVINDENAQFGRAFWLTGYSSSSADIAEGCSLELAACFSNAITGGLSKCKYIEIVVSDSSNLLEYKFLFHYRIIDSSKKWFLLNSDVDTFIR